MNAAFQDFRDADYHATWLSTPALRLPPMQRCSVLAVAIKTYAMSIYRLIVLMFGAMTFPKNQLPLCPYNALTKYAICRIVHMELNGRFKSLTTPGNWHLWNGTQMHDPRPLRIKTKTQSLMHGLSTIGDDVSLTYE
ncbi:cation channel family transporter [Aspergillus luchuensis]|uniref:Cation channel family transporter n=1 Tax=Aspergillus kawachii TaxID=1069201 RepID=A0A146FAR5_ASPKA|nr:cation channel family transporter [Aspergillus luchuensis]